MRAVPASPRNTVRLHEAAQAIGRLPHGAPLPDAAEVTRTRVVLCWEAAPGGGAPTAHRLLPDDDAWLPVLLKHPTIGAAVAAGDLPTTDALFEAAS